MITLFIILNLIAGLGQHVDNYLEQSLKPASYVKAADKAIKSQNPDGSWSAVVYVDDSRSYWGPAKHMNRYRDLCCAYHATGDVKYLNAAKRALNYWDSLAPVCKNWWWNEIGVPKVVGPATILARDGLDSSDIAKACKVLAKARLRATGQNKVWFAEVVMARAFLEGNDSLLVQARDSLVSEIRISDGVEGIQKDWAFHQHGPQLQWGNYGMSYGREISKIKLLLEGTPLDLNEDQKAIIYNYVTKGLLLPVWKGYLDMNACGREIMKNSQKEKAKTIYQVADRLGIEVSDTTGAFYFPSSDFGIYRTDSWYASVRCQSSRTKGMECVNKENMRGYFAADGALLIRRDGDEYFDVAGCWDWRHIPGVTSYDNGKPLYGWKSKKFYNATDNVWGKVEGEKMFVNMELNRDGLTGLKTWLFFEKGVLCTGTGISMKAGYRVQTGVEQCRIKGEVRNNKKWIHHNGITYIPLDGTKFKVAPREHAGHWHDIHSSHSKKMETLEMLDIYIDHGVDPESASYSYIIIADGSSPEDAYKYVKKNLSSLQKLALTRVTRVK